MSLIVAGVFLKPNSMSCVSCLASSSYYWSHPFRVSSIGLGFFESEVSTKMHRLHRLYFPSLFPFPYTKVTPSPFPIALPYWSIF